METESFATVAELPARGTSGERLAFAVLGASAGTLLASSLSVLVAALPLLAFAQVNPRIRTAVWATVWIAAAFATSGAVAQYLVRSRKPLLANERVTATSTVTFSGWPIVLTAALLLAAVGTLQESAPLRSLWADAMAVLREHRVLEGALEASQMSGFVLAPVAAVLAVPALQLLTTYAFIGSAVVLLLLLWPPSYRFSRAYLICVVLQASLVFASICGADLACGMATWLAEEASRIGGATRSSETAQILEVIERYKSVLTTTSSSLAWIFAGYAVWSVPLLASRSIRTTFAVRAPALAPVAPLRTVTALPAEARRRYYRDAARTLQPANYGAGVMLVGMVVAAAYVMKILAIR